LLLKTPAQAEENNKTIANQLVKGERANREKSCPGCGMFAFEIVFFNIFYWNFFSA
jgi:hypothetical protein